MQAAHNPAGGPVHSDAADAVDLDHLRRYTFGDQALEKEILALFMMQLPETIATLRGAVTAKDWKVAAHTLKGSCRAIGAFQLGEIAQESEKLEFERDSTPCREAISQIETAASEACQFIRSAYGLP